MNNLPYKDLSAERIFISIYHKFHPFKRDYTWNTVSTLENVQRFTVRICDIILTCPAGISLSEAKTNIKYHSFAVLFILD
jgi:hypothetical protein